MCFSAPASFSAAAALTTAGYFAVRKTTSHPQLPFAAIPFLFAAQQVAEGIFWLTATGSISPQWEVPAVLVFLVFAQVIWPAWVPVSVYFSETEKPRRRSLLVFVATGMALALYHTYCLFAFPVDAEVSGHHVAYTLSFPSPAGELGAVSYVLIGVLYVLVTVFPLFLSSAKRMNLLGLAVLASFFISLYFYTEYLVSIWCFFAALISGMVIWVVSERRPQLQAQLEKKAVN